jgi:hypothetical protein
VFPVRYGESVIQSKRRTFDGICENNCRGISYCDVHEGHEKVERCVLRLRLPTSILGRRARSSRQECDSERFFIVCTMQRLDTLHRHGTCYLQLDGTCTS